MPAAREVPGVHRTIAFAARIASNQMRGGPRRRRPSVRHEHYHRPTLILPEAPQTQAPRGAFFMRCAGIVIRDTGFR